MPLTTATISGRITDLLGTSGVRATVQLRPVTTSGPLLPTPDGDLRIGPLERETGGDGSLTIRDVPKLPQAGYEDWQWNVTVTPRTSHGPQFSASFGLTADMTWGQVASFAVSGTTVEPSAITQAVAARVAAEAARDAAVTAKTQAQAVGTTNDTVIAAQINTTSSKTRLALNAIYAASGAGSGGTVTTAALNAAIAALLAQVPSLEEQFVAVPILFPGEANPINMATTSIRELALFTAPFPLRILSVDFCFNSGVAANATNFYTVKLEKTLASGTSEAAIGQQSTATQAIVSDGHWPFTAPMNEAARVLPLGASFGLQIEPSGTPPPLNGPAVCTIRYARS